ncbi:hypothetical protein ACMXYW_04655 [Neptuniibacter sp. QD48_55]|uniref:hypothetical protein n=1 Tax=Neptuniibacter sp. QD48_55 TaxID=3398212 RepID=UPI0039F4DE40
MKYFSVFLALFLLAGCSKQEGLEVTLESTDNTATVSISNKEAVFIKESKTHTLYVASISGQSFLLKSDDSLLEGNLTFDYQKETESWLCATCVLLGYPLLWKKI